MRVLLAYPPYVYGTNSPPLGIMYIASVLERERHSVKIVDCSLNGKDFDSFVRKADLLGVSFTSQLIKETKELISHARAICPKIKIVVGGPHVTSFEKEVFKELPNVDYAVVGEGEYTVLELANEMDIEKIKGLLWKSDNGKIHVNQPRPLINNLDELPFPARHLVPLKKYSLPGAIVTSRGCPFRCCFCYKLSGRTYRAHSPNRVLSEMEEMRKNFKINEFMIDDDNFVADPKRVHEIIDGIIERNWKPKIVLGNGIRVDSIVRNENLVSKMAKAGVKQVSLGIESIIQEVLDASLKDITVEQVEKAIAILRKYDISFSLYLMVGLPKDSYENVEKTKKWLKENHVKGFGISMATPYPKTKLWNYVSKYGRWLKLPDQSSYSWHNLIFVHPVWDTLDFSAEDRMKALLELRYFAAKKLIKQVKIYPMLIRHPKIPLWWLSKWLSSTIKQRFSR